MVGLSNLFMSRPVKPGQQRRPRRTPEQIRRDAALHERLGRAAAIVMTCTITANRDGWLVQSQSDPQRYYRVDSAGCSCADAWRAPSGMCKHRLACALYAHVQEALSA